MIFDSNHDKPKLDDPTTWPHCSECWVCWAKLTLEDLAVARRIGVGTHQAHKEHFSGEFAGTIQAHKPKRSPILGSVLEPQTSMCPQSTQKIDKPTGTTLAETEPETNIYLTRHGAPLCAGTKEIMDL